MVMMFNGSSLRYDGVLPSKGPQHLPDNGVMVLMSVCQGGNEHQVRRYVRPGLMKWCKTERGVTYLTGFYSPLTRSMMIKYK